MRLIFITGTVKAGYQGNMADPPNDLTPFRTAQSKFPSTFICAADPMQKADDDYMMHGNKYNALFLDGRCSAVNDASGSIRAFMAANAPASTGPNDSRTCFNMLYTAGSISPKEY